ncbi:MAG: hypothetical protein ACKVRN_15520 [Pyrinomonadaceae bacterium]
MQSAQRVVETKKSVVKQAPDNAVRNGAAAKAGHIVALIPRGEVIRNFVHSGVFDEVKANASLSLLSISTKSETDDMLHEKFEQVYPLNEVWEKWLVRFLRELIDVAHGRWLWSQAAQERWRLRDSEAKSIRQKASRAMKKVVTLPFSSRAGLNVLTKTERLSSRILNSTDEYINLYKKIKPSLVFNGSHIHSRNAIQAVQAANWLGIPTATFVFSWDNLTSQGRIGLPYDYFIVWNDTLKAQLLEMYEWIKPENVFVTGTPQFDFHFRKEFHLSREEYCDEIGADPQRPIVFYATGMANHMPNEPEIVEGIADMLTEFPDAERPQLLVRVYAKDLTGRFDDLRQRRRDILFADPVWEQAWLTPKYEDAFTLVNALRHCSLGINVASTVSLELCMFDKPVINVGYNPPSVLEEELSYADYYEFDHYKPVVESGAVQVAWNVGEMRELIKNALSTPEEFTKQRTELIDRMFGSTLDGGSSARVAKTLLKITQNGR